MFLSFIDVVKNIVDGLSGVWQTVRTIDWETVKNWVFSGGGVLLVGLFAKYGIPFFKNSNKPILVKMATLYETVDGLITEIKQLRAENKTIKDGVKGTIHYLELNAEVNLSSKVLTQEQKEKFTQASEMLKTIGTNLAVETAELVEKVIEDNTITVDEAIEIAEKNKEIEKAFGTPISSLLK